MRLTPTLLGVDLVCVILFVGILLDGHTAVDAYASDRSPFRQANLKCINTENESRHSENVRMTMRTTSFSVSANGRSMPMGTARSATALFVSSQQPPASPHDGDSNLHKNPSKRKALVKRFLSTSSAVRTVTQRVLCKAKSKVHALRTAARHKRRNMLAAAALFFAVAMSSFQGNQGLGASASLDTAAAPATSGPEVVRLASTDVAAGPSRSPAGVLQIGRAKVGRKGSLDGGEAISARARARPVVQMASTSGRPTSLIAPKPPAKTKLPMAAVTAKEAKSETAVPKAIADTERTLKEAFSDLREYMAGPKSDTMLLLLATALVTPLCKKAGISPILGFLAAGMMMGPNAAGVVQDVHNIEVMAELGIVFFLFEMGIELSIERLKSMRKDVFGLGLTQFLGTAAAVAAVGKLAFNLPGNALIVLGGGLALSSSAFVLQLLKDKEQLSTRFGKASFGILLLQDLAVVPLLVVTPILAGGGQGLGAALGSALVKATIALSTIAFTGNVILNPLFNTVAKAKTQEAFLGVILFTVLGMSFMTEGLGLSNTLGAFLAGVLLSETKYRYQIEADIAPFRGILLGLFFVTVGFEIDLGLVFSQLPLVSAVVFAIIAIKAAVAALASLAFGLTPSTSLQTGLIVSQAGEFAFVAFGLAKSFGILTPTQTKFLLTCVSLTMALTPLLSSVGAKAANQLSESSADANNMTMTCDLEREAEDRSAIENDDFVIVVGWGVVGKTVADLLERRFFKYEVLEVDPVRAAEGRAKGLPIFYGDVARPEIADAFNVGKAKAVIVAISDKSEATRVVIALRRQYPELKIFARATDSDHAKRLQQTLDVVAMVPIVPEDNVLLTLPFGGAVLKSLGAKPEEVNAILESKRKSVLDTQGLSESEDEATLVELGITTEEERTEAINELKERSPMVAEFLESKVNVVPSKALEEIEEEEGEEDLGTESGPSEQEGDQNGGKAVPAVDFQRARLERQLSE